VGEITHEVRPVTRAAPRAHRRDDNTSTPNWEQHLASSIESAFDVDLTRVALPGIGTAHRNVSSWVGEDDADGVDVGIRGGLPGVLYRKRKGPSNRERGRVGVDPDLTALTSTAATTVVQLLATAAWEQAKSAVGGLWRRVHPERAETVQAELEETRAEVLAAREIGDEQAEQALVSEWHSRLRRLVAVDPQLADDLRRVLAELRSALADADTAPGSTISMQAMTFGTSRVNQAGRDLHITTGE
jgi:hypothetical protein